MTKGRIAAAPFMKEDLHNFDPRESYKELIADFHGDKKDERLVFMTLLDEDSRETIAIAGLFELRKGVAELMLIPGKKVKDYQCEIFKVLYRLIHNFVQPKLGLHRLEIALDCKWDMGKKWANKLGFEFEGIRKCYDYMKNDYAIYVRIQ